MAGSLPVATGGATGTGVWTDIAGLSALKAKAEANGQSALPAVAKQFEAVFIEMLIHSMRQASVGGGAFDSQEMQQWQGIFDQQIALSLANDGSGIGIAAMLERQLGPRGGAQASAPTALALPEGATPASGAGATGPASAWPAGLLGRLTLRVEHGLTALEHWAQGAASNAGADGFTDADDFVRRLAPYAEQAARALGVSVRAVLAQAALETHWGQHVPRCADGESSHNLFGIKAGRGWAGAAANAPTLEYVGGRAVVADAAFRAYAGPAQSFVDYVRTLAGNPRYAAAIDRGSDVAGFAAALVHGGYATDPAYAQKLTAIADGAEMDHALALLKSSVDRPISSEP